MGEGERGGETSEGEGTKRVKRGVGKGRLPFQSLLFSFERTFRAVN